ncbi:MAG TPA: glycosyltransferase [Terriglobia bacterium]|nr:glycosyltransferase [Terriglobia bacterium]
MDGFFVFAILLLLQSFLSLRGGFRFLRLLRKSLRLPPAPYHPRAAVIIPCKGCDEDLERNAARYLAQDYPSHQVIFVVASESDPAYGFLASLIRQDRQKHESSRLDEISKIPVTNPLSSALVVAGYSNHSGEKVNNLLAGLRAVDAGVEALVFADIDAEPHPGWLRALVAPLGDPAVTVSTGFRWYLPGARFASRLRAAWDSSIATMMGEHRHNLAWGGSMAIRRADFNRLRIAEDYWQGTVSDDYALARAVREAGGTIRFEPRCLLASRNLGGFMEFLRWANRQIIITRVYHARYWKLGVASYALYALTFVWGLALILLSGSSVSRVAAAAMLSAIIALGMAKGALRSVAAREIFPSEASTLARYGACYWRLTPLVPWVMFWNFAVAGFVRRIEWRGTVYELKSKTELKVIRRGNEVL